MITPHDLPGRAMSGTPPGSPDKQAEKEGRMAAEMYQKNIAQAQAENPTMDATSAGLETESPASMEKISNPLGNDANHDSNYKGKADEGFGKRTLVMWLLYLPVIFLFGMCYTEMGYGATTFKALSHHYDKSSKVVLAVFAVLFVAYTYDIGEWHGRTWTVLRNAIFALVTAASGTAAMMAFQGFPYLPLAVVLTFVPVWFGFIRIVLFSKVHVVDYVRSVGVVNVITGVFCLLTATIWCSVHNYWWGDDSKLRFKSVLLVDDLPTASACLSDCSWTNGLAAPSCSQGWVHPKGQEYMDAEEIDGDACFNLWSSTECLSLENGQYWEENKASGSFETFVESNGKAAAGAGTDGWLPHSVMNPACQSFACQKLMSHDSQAYCLPAFLLYSSQFIAAIAVMMLGSVSVMFARSVQHQHKHHVENQMNPVIKMFLTVGSVLLVMMWAAASIAGASMKTSNLVFALAFVAMAVMCITVGATIGKQALESELSKIPLVKNFSGAGSSVGFQGFFMLVGGWVFLPFFFFISFWNQLNRKYLQCTKDINQVGTEVNENELHLTLAGHRIWVAIKKWKWTLVFRKVIFWGTVYFVLSVGAAKYTNLFLAELLAALKRAELSLFAVSIVYIFVGLCMFLLPPVPGVPVYLTGGILLSGMAEKQFRPAMCAMEAPVCTLVPADSCTLDCATQMDHTAWSSQCEGTATETGGCLTPFGYPGGANNLGADGMATANTYFYIGILYASMFAFATKLLAISMQQKGIGGLLGKRVGIRQMVDVNSDTMKAIKVILTGEGWITKGKVCILVGGPDWPTSVLTGVLGLDLFPMLVGSLPVSLPIALTVAAGATLLKTDSSWVAIQGFTLSLAAMGQSILLVAALTEIEKTRKTHAAEIRALADDEEVKKLDEQVQREADAMLKATQWSRVPFLFKLILFLAAASMMIATLLFMWTGCFESVEVTTDLKLLEDHLDPEHKMPMSLSIITRPYGYIACAAEVLAWILNYLFGCWASRAAAKELKQSGAEP